ncbi:hypothetical protein [Pseudonocardia sp.]|uniref:hypothetical protein n=1 Tax=Pseudonocardia sp. TaxID=60912 RepID=UPI00260CCF8E|nr:hypothetical protein [Pseudonocardia sp.]
MTDGARDELRELLFDGVGPPADADAMFERTFAATGDDGAHLLPPGDLFDGDGDGPDDPAPDDPALDDPAPDDPALLDDVAGPVPDGDPVLDEDLADDWSDPAAGASDPEPAVVEPAAPDEPFDPTSGW